MTVNTFPHAVKCALIIMSEHPQVLHVSSPQLLEDSQSIKVNTDIKVNLAPERENFGQSSTGVKSTERVQFEFKKKYPLISPNISLRKDFPRNFPHLFITESDNLPRPCIFDGNFDELIHLVGFGGILDRVVDWLYRASTGNLIDPSQGWEPMRRDYLKNFIFADIENIRQYTFKNRFKVLEFKYTYRISNEVKIVNGEITDHSINLDSDNSQALLFEEENIQNRASGYGKSAAILIWPQFNLNKSNYEYDEYMTDTAITFNDLLEIAKKFDCHESLNTAINYISKNVKRDYKSKVSIAFIFVIQRPFKLIGSKSNFELIPYIVEIEIPIVKSIRPDALVRQTQLLSNINRNLLLTLSDRELNTIPLQWTLIGAGSLGSKIAIHHVRSGSGPNIIIDKSVMLPHNYARHAILPSNLNNFIVRRKVDLLTDTIEQFNQPVETKIFDIKDLDDLNDITEFFPENSWGIVNTTASPIVRESMSCNKNIKPRIIETTLYSRSKYGIVTIEGPNRNPNTGDLISEIYTRFSNNKEMSEAIFGEDTGMARQIIGEGCGSLTMPVSDAKISLFAASMSEIISKFQSNGLPKDDGQIFIGQQIDNGLSLNWNTYKVSPVEVIEYDSDEKWQIRLNSKVVEKISEEIEKKPDLETGGVLIGRISETSKAIFVVDLIDAPPDSKFSPTEFILGIEGLYEKINAYSNKSGNSLYCLGTWHNHLENTPPSRKDQECANSISVSRMIPSILLIRTPDKFDVLFANVADR